ncbi:MAG: hypothetical protein H0U87_00105 [Acidobacteria bacterium]|nr:hypothetical protein [Acidobacteriota bacterium]
MRKIAEKIKKLRAIVDIETITRLKSTFIYIFSNRFLEGQENLMSLIKIIVYTLAFLLSVLYLGRFFF